jgi:hypothetical protein
MTPEEARRAEVALLRQCYDEEVEALGLARDRISNLINRLRELGEEA